MSNTGSTLKNIGRNIISLSASELICRILGAITLLLLPRYLGPRDYGVYALSLSYLAIFTIISSYGLDALYIKDVARDKELAGPYFTANFVIKGTLSIVSIAVLWGIIHYLDYPPETNTVIIIMSSMLFFTSLTSTFTAVFRAYERMEFNAVLSISRSVIMLAGVVAIINLHGTLLWVAMLSVLATLSLAIIGQYVITTRFIRGWSRVSRQDIVDALKKSTPFFIVGAVAVVQARIDIIMISKLASEYEVGIYNAGYELINILYIVPNLTATVLFPIFSRQFAESPKGFIRSSTLSIKYIILIALPASAGMYILAPQVIHLFYGSEFNNAAGVLQIFSLGISILFVAYIISYVLTATELIKYVIWANAASVVVNVLLNLWFIPRWGAKGAAYSSLISAVIRSVIIYAVSKINYGEIAILRNLLKPIIATLIMSAFIARLNLHIVLTVLAGVIAYAISIYFLKVVKKDEIMLIRGMMPFLS